MSMDQLVFESGGFEVASEVSPHGFNETRWVCEIEDINFYLTKTVKYIFEEYV